MTVLDVPLHDSLRTLKLSGMLETLDARLTQAAAGELGHLDFLQVLCQDEITGRDAMSMTPTAPPRPLRRRPRRPQLAPAPRRAHPTGFAHPRRLRHAGTHPTTSRRPLRTHQRTHPSRPLTDHHLEPHPTRLVPTVPEPRRRRITPRPAHQHQPPRLHERTQLPTKQTTRARRPPDHHEHQ